MLENLEIGSASGSERSFGFSSEVNGSPPVGTLHGWGKYSPVNGSVAGFAIKPVARPAAT